MKVYFKIKVLTVCPSRVRTLHPFCNWQAFYHTSPWSCGICIHQMLHVGRQNHILFRGRSSVNVIVIVNFFLDSKDMVELTFWMQ